MPLNVGSGCFNFLVGGEGVLYFLGVLRSAVSGLSLPDSLVNQIILLTSFSSGI